VSVATEDDLRRIALSLPETEERAGYGKRPSWKVRGRGFVGIWKDEQSAVISIADLEERRARLVDEPEKFFTTPPYGDGPHLLVRLDRVDAAELRELVIESWRGNAPDDLVTRFDEGS
jgi:hypothetical protein